MNLGIGAIEEMGNHFRALRDFWMVGMLGLVGLKIERGIFLVAFGREADVVELHFVNSRLGHELCQRNVVVLNLHVRWIGPDQFSIFAPRLARAMRLYSQLRMRRNQVFIAEDRDSRNGMHVLRMKEVNKLWQVGDVMTLSGCEWVIESDIDYAVTILDVENHGVASNLAPVADDAFPVFAPRHYARQVDRSDFEISCNWCRFLYNGGFENSGDYDLFSRLEKNTLPVVLGLPDGIT